MKKSRKEKKTKKKRKVYIMKDMFVNTDKHLI